MCATADDRQGRTDRDLEKRRPWLLRLLSVSVGLAMVVGLGEGVLWFLPVSDRIPYWSLDEANDVFRYQPDQDFLWSRGWRLRQAHRIRTNNVGFVSDTEYVKDTAEPVLAFLGDSYVEALMVSYRQTCAGRLATSLEGRTNVYSFGVSGAPLSEYLGYSQFARDNFEPQWLIVVVVGNDFDESLRQYRRGDQFRSFVERDGELILSPGVPLERSSPRPQAAQAVRRVIWRSSLVRYLTYNVQVVNRYHIAVGRLVDTFFRDDEGIDDREWSARTSDDDRPVQSRRAIDAFLTMLPRLSGLSQDRILLVVDGLRPAMYDPRALEIQEQSYFGKMRTRLLQNARDRGYVVVDMQPVFIERYAASGTRFEWEHDGHWNALGHGACYEEVVRRGFPYLDSEL